MQSLIVIVAVALAVGVVSLDTTTLNNRDHHGKNHSFKPQYNINTTMDWLAKQGCANASITNCPGNRLCTDAEFYSRALAAGGVIDLDPNSTSQVPFLNYSGYNLCLGPDMIAFLEEVGFQALGNNHTFPRGSIAFTQMYPPGMPFIADGHSRCTSHTPIVANGPHCEMPCPYFIPRIIYAWSK